MEQGRIIEEQQIDADNATHNTMVFRPTEEQINSSEFKSIVGEAQYTPGGLPKGTIVDIAGDTNVEIKSGSSKLSASYQLRLQVYEANVKNRGYELRTSRPVTENLANLIKENGGEITSLK